MELEVYSDGELFDTRHVDNDLLVFPSLGQTEMYFMDFQDIFGKGHSEVKLYGQNVVSTPDKESTYEMDAPASLSGVYTSAREEGGWICSSLDVEDKHNNKTHVKFSFNPKYADSYVVKVEELQAANDQDATMSFLQDVIADSNNAYVATFSLESELTKKDVIEGPILVMTF